MDVRFVKMHGLGNDYVFIDGICNPLPDLDWPEVARAVSPRHTAIGSDGLILILPPEEVPGPPGAAASMRMFNADGSEGEMCGNGVRCLGWYIHDRGYAPGSDLVVATPAGPIAMSIHGRERVRVDMGEPRFEDPLLPRGVGEEGLTIATSAGPVTLWPVSTGVPHAVAFPGTGLSDWRAAGREIEVSPHFPRRTNVEFVTVKARDHLEVKVWERGSGPTMACGTGAAATLAVAVRLGLSDGAATISLPGGDLVGEWVPDGPVLLTGPVAESFRGSFTWPVP